MSTTIEWKTHPERPDLCVACIPTFNCKELEVIGSFVRGLRDEWQQYQGSSLWSLGTPAYRFSGHREEYRRRVRPQNELFRRALGSVYRTLLGRLASAVRAPVKLMHEVAHPGFHILKFDEQRTFEPGAPHTDAPHRRVPWLDPSSIEECPGLSFVVPIELPRAPTGVELFPQWGGAAATAQISPLTQRYQCGTSYVFSGSWNHRIAPVSGDPDEMRLTMQGHLITVNGEVIAFW